MRLKRTDYVGAGVAVLLAATLPVFPFINPCTTEDSTACTWRADITGNHAGQSFTNYYGVTLYHP